MEGGKLGVTWVRGDQMRRLNIGRWEWETGRGRWRRRKTETMLSVKEKKKKRKKMTKKGKTVSMPHSLCHMSACPLDPLHAWIIWFIIYMTLGVWSQPHGNITKLQHVDSLVLYLISPGAGGQESFHTFTWLNRVWVFAGGWGWWGWVDKEQRVLICNSKEITIRIYG